jgi:hypothetical protein
MSTARGFIGMEEDGCCAIFEAHGRLDFFKVLSPPVSRDLFILCADVDYRFIASGF